MFVWRVKGALSLNMCKELNAFIEEALHFASVDPVCRPSVYAFDTEHS